MKLKTRQLLNQNILYGIDTAFRKYQQTNGELDVATTVEELKEEIEDERRNTSGTSRE